MLDPASVAAMSFDELMNLSVTVASRSEEKFIEAPSSVTVFSRNEILNMGIRTVEELLNYVPGIQSTRDASRNVYQVSSRGRNTALGSNDTLFLLNGQRINDDFHGAALIFNRFLSTGNVRQVEVIRGPGSALYGANAFLSVVNIVTDDNLNGMYIGGGSHDKKEAYLNLSHQGGGYRASLFINAFKDDGERFTDRSDPFSGSIRDPRESISAFATLEVERLRIELRHARFEVDDFYLFSTTPSADVNNYDSQDSSVNLTYRLVDNDRGTLKFNGGYRYIEESGLAEISSLPLMPPFRGGPVVEESEYHFSLDGVFDLNDAHRISAGIGYRYTYFDKIRNQNNYEVVDIISGIMPPAFYGSVVETAEFGPEKSSRTNYGLYVQDRYEISDRLSTTLGVRFDDYSDFGSTVNPRLAMVYKASEDATFKLLYGEAFRAPTISELGQKNSPVSVGNPDLDPERIRTAEVAWLQNFGTAQTIVTGFYSWLTDRIVQVPLMAPGPPRRTFANGSDLDLSGLEFEINAELWRGMFLRGTYTHFFKTDADPRDVSRNLASFIFNYRQGDWNVNLNGVFHDDVERTSSDNLDSYWIANLYARRELGGFTLVGGVTNLFDSEHDTYTQAPIPDGTPNRGREFNLGIELDF